LAIAFKKLFSTPLKSNLLAKFCHPGNKRSIHDISNSWHRNGTHSAQKLQGFSKSKNTQNPVRAPWLSKL